MSNSPVLSSSKKFSAFLDGDVRDQARTVNEISSAIVPIPKTKRASLSDSDRARLYSSAIIGLDVKFSLMAPTDGTEELGSVYNLAIRSNEFKASLMTFQMDDVFNIIPMDSTGIKPDSSKTARDLFNSYKDVTLDEVRRSSRYYYEYGKDYHVENLRWSMEKLLNSCDIDLKEKIAEKSLSLPLIEHGGPTYFKIMMDCISSVTDKSLRAITVRVETMTLQDFPGENVAKAASYLRGTLKTLENCGFVPKDIETVICQIFKTASTTDFRSYIGTIYTNFSLGLIKLSAEDIIYHAEKEYYTLLRCGKWEAGEDSGSAAFANELHRTDKRDIICYNCGKKGHMSRDCRLPRNKQSGRGDNSRKNNRRKGRDGNKKRTPPGKGEPHERTGPDGRKEYWNGQTGEWTSQPTNKTNDKSNDVKTSAHVTSLHNQNGTLVHNGGNGSFQLSRTGI